MKYFLDNLDRIGQLVSRAVREHVMGVRRCVCRPRPPSRAGIGTCCRCVCPRGGGSGCPHSPGSSHKPWLTAVDGGVLYEPRSPNPRKGAMSKWGVAFLLWKIQASTDIKSTVKPHLHQESLVTPQGQVWCQTILSVTFSNVSRKAKTPAP